MSSDEKVHLLTERCSFLGPDTVDVVVARDSHLEVVSSTCPRLAATGDSEASAIDVDVDEVAPLSFPVVLDSPVGGRISTLLSFRPEYLSSDVLFLSTEQHEFAVISHDPTSRTTVTHCTGILNDNACALVGREAQCSATAAVDPLGRCIAVHTFNGYVKILPILPYRSGSGDKSALAGKCEGRMRGRDSRQAQVGCGRDAGPSRILGDPFDLRVDRHGIRSMTFLEATCEDHQDATAFYANSGGKGGSAGAGKGASTTSKMMDACLSHPRLVLGYLDAREGEHIDTHCIDLVGRNIVFCHHQGRGSEETSGGASESSTSALATPQRSAVPQKALVDAGSAKKKPAPSSRPASSVADVDDEDSSNLGKSVGHIVWVTCGKKDEQHPAILLDSRALSLNGVTWARVKWGINDRKELVEADRIATELARRPRRAPAYFAKVNNMHTGAKTPASAVPIEIAASTSIRRSAVRSKQKKGSRRSDIIDAHSGECYNGAKAASSTSSYSESADMDSEGDWSCASDAELVDGDAGVNESANCSEESQFEDSPFNSRDKNEGNDLKTEHIHKLDRFVDHLVWVTCGNKDEQHPAILLNSREKVSEEVTWALVKWEINHRIACVPVEKIATELSPRPRRTPLFFAREDNQSGSNPCSVANGPTNAVRVEKAVCAPRKRRALPSKQTSRRCRPEFHSEDDLFGTCGDATKKTASSSSLCGAALDLDSKDSDIDSQSISEVMMSDYDGDRSQSVAETQSSDPSKSTTATSTTLVEDGDEEMSVGSIDNLKESIGHLVWVQTENCAQSHPAILLSLSGLSPGEKGTAEIRWQSTGRIASVPIWTIATELPRRSRCAPTFFSRESRQEGRRSRRGNKPHGANCRGDAIRHCSSGKTKNVGISGEKQCDTRKGPRPVWEGEETMCTLDSTRVRKAKYYEVQKVLKHRRRDDRDEYLIKWTGTSRSTWEPEDNLCQQTIVDAIQLKDASERRRRLIGSGDSGSCGDDELHDQEFAVVEHFKDLEVESNFVWQSAPTTTARVNFAFHSQINDSSRSRRWPPRKRPTVVDLFAGVGGMGLGYKEAGFDVRWVVEKESLPAMRQQITHPEAILYQEDVKVFVAKARTGTEGYPTAEEVDHVHASPPCQGFSGANRGGRYDIENRELCLMFLHAVEIFKPVTALFENVGGILYSKNCSYLKQIVSRLTNLNYQVRVAFLDASTYGDAQRRKRVFVFAALAGWRLPPIPIPTHGTKLQPVITARDVLSDLENIPAENGSGIISLQNETVHNHQTASYRYRIENDDRIEPDKPAYTIMRSTRLAHYSKDRLLTVREVARLFSFPDSFQFYGPPRDQYAQLGNSVSVRMASAVAHSIMKTFRPCDKKASAACQRA